MSSFVAYERCSWKKCIILSNVIVIPWILSYTLRITSPTRRSSLPCFAGSKDSILCRVDYSPRSRRVYLEICHFVFVKSQRILLELQYSGGFALHSLRYTFTLFPRYTHSNKDSALASAKKSEKHSEVSVVGKDLKAGFVSALAKDGL